MSRSPSDPANPDDPALLAARDDTASSPIPATTPAQRSRIGTVWVGGHFDPAVARALKMLALQEGTTVQALIGKAFNDLLERAGLGRPASETVLPRGGAAQRRGDHGQR
jgi:hypothetical protein